MSSVPRFPPLLLIDHRQESSYGLPDVSHMSIARKRWLSVS